MGEGIQRRGWDGIVVTPVGNAFVPVGISAWELGTGKDVRGQAEDNFKKRTDDSLGLDTRQVSFVFVTPHKWEGKTDWCREKNELGVWKEVRVYDSANLEEWLEVAPAVDVWLARLVGKRPPGAADIAEHWENLAALTEPSLRPEVFLVSRKRETEMLSEWLTGPPTALAFEARSPVEVIDFFAAYLVALDQPQREAHEARIIIVEEREAWRALTACKNRLVLIAHPRFPIEAELVAEAIRGGHHVLLSSRRFAGESAEKRILPLTYRHDLEKELVASGFNEEEASRLARESGGSLTILKRRLAHFASTAHPLWGQPPEANNLVPILLAGAWDDASPADQAVIAKLAGRPYSEVLALANRWLTSEDPPIMRMLTRWSLVSREDSWALLASCVTREQLDAFEEVVLDVLGEDDPRYELPSEDRWLASIYQKVPKHSHSLRTGLAETIVLLGAKAEMGLVAHALMPAGRAERLVRKLLPVDVDWRRWASLSDLLPLLAEASPEAILDAVENDLRQSEPHLFKLFAQETDSFFSSSPHPGLLWALETLAWNPAYLSRVCLILARLARNDPGGKVLPRPQDSLRRIFLPWYPQTSSSSEERLRVLDVLIKREPEVAWDLLLSLLPQAGDHAFPTHRPYWREWGMNWSGKVTEAEYQQQIEGIAERLLQNVLDHADRWEQLIDELQNFPERTRNRILSRLKDFDLDAFEPGARVRIWNTLRKKVRDHRYFSDAWWALPARAVDKLEAIQARFEPQDLISKYAWLFTASMPDLRQSREETWETEEAKVFEARIEALRQILASGGLSMIINLAEVAEDSHSVGYVLGKAELLVDDSEVLPVLLTADSKKLHTFALGYVSGRFASGGWKWVEQLLITQWSPEQAGTLATVLPFERRTWEFVERLGADVREHYWKDVNGYGYWLTAAEVEEVVAVFLEHQRPLEAVRVLHSAHQSWRSLPWQLIAQSLEAVLKSSTQLREDGAVSLHMVYKIQELFRLLQSDQAVDTQQLASLEWGFLPLFDNHRASPKALHDWMQRDPHLFTEVVSLAFRSRNEPKKEGELSEDKKTRARLAYDLIKTWRTVPGTLENGVVDGAFLLQWVRSAREECGKMGRLEICDVLIGEVLAYAPVEADGVWPCVAVREVIEQVDSNEIARGFQIGIFNKRGAHFKAPGGSLERELAQRYRDYADACAIEWPRTAAALRAVASEYEEEARREDETVGEM